MTYWLQKRHMIWFHKAGYYSLKMYKTSHEVINFIEKAMQTWRVELTAGGRSITETKIQRCIFQGNSPSLLPFIIAMTPLNHLLWKCTAGYKLSRSQDKNNHLMYIDDVRLFAKNEKELKTLIHAVRIYIQDMAMEFGIEKFTMLVMKHGKVHMTEVLTYQITTKLKRTEKRKPTNTWVSWRLTPSNSGNER